MKAIKLISLLLFMSLTLWCCEEDEESEDPDRQTVTISLQNSTGAQGCANSEEITFIVSYRDIQVDATINPGGAFGVINVLVEDGESIDVQVRTTDTNDVIASSSVEVNFSGSGVARVTYCQPFDLIFTNF